MGTEKLRLGGILVLVFLLATSAMFAGCLSDGDDGDGNGDGNGNGNGQNQTISIGGSTTVLPIADAAASEYMDLHSEADIRVAGGGSSVGIQGVAQGTVDIGMASRDLKDSEKEDYPELVQHVIAYDGIAIIVHTDNPVRALSVEEIRGIYNGTYTKWSDFAGADEDIVVFGRDSASGTREFFHDFVMEKEDFIPTMLEKNSNGAVHDSVETTPGAVGFVGLGFVDQDVRAVDINTTSGAVEPTVAHVIDGSYPIARNLNMFTDGEPDGLAKAFLDFLKSADGQDIVEDEGFVPLT